MIIGIGTDIIEIERIQKTAHLQSFLNKIYTADEQQLFHTGKYNTMSGNFACKEAVAKALGTGFSGFTPKDIEVLRNSYGKPFVNLYNGALSEFNKLKATNIHVSISHNKTQAIAFAVIDRQEVI